MIHALPVAAAIKRHRPDCRLTWLIDERWQALLAGNPSIDETVIFPRQKLAGPGGALRSVPWAVGLGRLKPKVALDLQGLLRSAIMARMSGAKRVVGLADAREGAGLLFHEIVPVFATEHAVRRYLRSLQALGLPHDEPPEFFLPPGIPSNVAGSYLLFHPFARGGGKSLAPEAVVQFCEALRPFKIVLAGTGQTPRGLPDHVINLLNRTDIGQLIGLIRAAAFVVSVDSGPMHVAAAVNPRLLSIHTWSDPRLIGPCTEAAWIWQGGEIRPQQLGDAVLPDPRTPDGGDIDLIARWTREQLGL